MVEQKLEKLLVGGSSPSPNILCLAELVDAVDLKSISFMSIGSSPIAVIIKKFFFFNFFFFAKIFFVVIS